LNTSSIPNAVVRANPFTTKLLTLAAIPADEQVALDAVVSERFRAFEARRDVIEEGQRPDYVHIVISGWAYRYKQLDDGRRQIIAFLLPGDCCDHHVLVLKKMDHTIATLTAATLSRVSRDRLTSLVAMSDRLQRALWWEAETNASIAREWIVSLGQRDALERVAHLLCEIFHRLRIVGMTNGQSCELPITQTDLADATGMTPVHVNRTVQELRSRNLINWSGRRLVLPDLAALEAVACFDASYLHYNEDGS
jgi:CRP-like cAMP-binding protein